MGLIIDGKGRDGRKERKSQREGNDVGVAGAKGLRRASLSLEQRKSP